MASQCIGAAAAAVVSLVVFPWFARPQAARTLATFQSSVNASLEKVETAGGAERAAAMVEHLLQARRDISSADEAKAWMPAAADNADLSERLTNAAFGSVAVEGILAQYELGHNDIPGGVTDQIKAGDLDGALGAIRDALGADDAAPRNDLARLYIEVLLLRECLKLLS